MQYSEDIEDLENMARRYSLTKKRKHLTYMYLKAEKANFGELQLIVNGIPLPLRKAIISPDPERPGHWRALQHLPIRRKEKGDAQGIYATSVSANGPTETEAVEALGWRLKIVCAEEGWGLAGDAAPSS